MSTHIPADLSFVTAATVVHLVSAAIGAEQFYTTENNATRSETVAEARQKDQRTREVWVGHPYVDIVDNLDTITFEDKMLKLIQVVCDRAGVGYGDRLAKNSRKRKFLVTAILEDRFPSYQEFYVVHDYLHSDRPNVQSRIRKRGQGGKFSYTHTVRRTVEGEPVETRMQIADREYKALKAHKDFRRYATYKKRRCFMHGNQYYQLDIYQTPLPPRSPTREGLMLLETYTTSTDPSLDFPDCLQVSKEVTSDPAYSMYNMSLREDASPVLRPSTSQQSESLDLAANNSKSSTNLHEEAVKHMKKKNSPPMFRYNTPPRNIQNGDGESEGEGTGGGTGGGSCGSLPHGVGGVMNGVP